MTTTLEVVKCLIGRIGTASLLKLPVLDDAESPAKSACITSNTGDKITLFKTRFLSQ